eukprot:7240642-Prymnesium_polylepis.2
MGLLPCSPAEPTAVRGVRRRGEGSPRRVSRAEARWPASGERRVPRDGGGRGAHHTVRTATGHANMCQLDSLL